MSASSGSSHIAVWPWHVYKQVRPYSSSLEQASRLPAMTRTAQTSMDCAKEEGQKKHNRRSRVQANKMRSRCAVRSRIRGMQIEHLR